MYKTTAIFLVVVTGLFIGMTAAPDVATTVRHRVLDSLTQVTPATPFPQSSSLLQLRSIKTVSAPPRDAAEMLTTNSIVDATNRERINAGLPPLKLNDKLVASAMQKTDDMIAKQYFEHVSPSGVSVSDLGRKAGYSYIIMGENLALGDFVDGTDVVQAWMDSPGHRANILNPSYEEIGAYAAKGMYQGKEVWFAVQHFGTPREVCPAISPTLKTSIDALNGTLKQRQSQIANEKATLEAENHPEGDAYTTMVTDFNNLVAEYNTTLVISQEKIKAYNAQVSQFNSCLAHYQTPAIS